MSEVTEEVKKQRKKDPCTGCKYRLCVGRDIGSGEKDYTYKEVCIKCGKVRKVYDTLYMSHTEEVVNLGPHQIKFWP